MPALGGKKWGDFDDDEDEGLNTPKGDDVGKGFETKPDADGIKTVIEYIERDGKTFKLTKRVKQTITTTWTNRKIQDRKSMGKFGKAAENDPAAEKHLVVRSEEEISIELSKKVAAQLNVKDEAEDKFYEESLTIAETLNQQKKAWTEINKLKQEGREEAGAAPVVEETVAEAPKPGELPKTTGGYVPPSLRGGAGDPKGKGKGKDDQDQASLRVTNLAEDCKEGDLQELFGSVGRVSRVYVARDQDTKMSRGFAFVTYYTKQDAEKAIRKLDGHPYDNLILRVMFAKPRA